MSEKLKLCPFCGAKLKRGVFDRETFYEHPDVNGCILRAMLFPKKQWNSRPIEDKLEASIAWLKAKNKKLRGRVKAAESALIYTEYQRCKCIVDYKQKEGGDE